LIPLVLGKQSDQTPPLCDSINIREVIPCDSSTAEFVHCRSTFIPLVLVSSPWFH